MSPVTMITYNGQDVIFGHAATAHDTPADPGTTHGLSETERLRRDTVVPEDGDVSWVPLVLADMASFCSRAERFELEVTLLRTKVMIEHLIQAHDLSDASDP
ncbi:hypothetical protein KUV51_01260 [Tateyamaria omphalii]|uniref:hypothetical protein n=1 Tax=Tateyamaria omphalii TaxID=299262 RepID=UPI001C9933F1|nr:hypothetical protein [Tateyamaria omphalii]MBY5931610.1 hypothetical protein [Tateyamaria omphalii]